MHMDFLFSTIISGIAYDAIKKGICITSNFLKGKLTDWIIDENMIDKLVVVLGEIPKPCTRSKELIKAHLDLDDRFSEIVKTVKPDNLTKNYNNYVEYNEGVLVNEMNGNIVLSQKDTNDSVNRLKTRAFQCLESKKKLRHENI